MSFTAAVMAMGNVASPLTTPIPGLQDEFQTEQLYYPNLPHLSGWIGNWWSSEMARDDLCKILRIYADVLDASTKEHESQETWNEELERTKARYYTEVREVAYDCPRIPRLAPPLFADVWNEVLLFQAPENADQDWFQQVCIYRGRQLVNYKAYLFEAICRGRLEDGRRLVEEIIAEQPICNRALRLFERIESNWHFRAPGWPQIAMEVFEAFLEDADEEYELYLVFGFFMQIAQIQTRHYVPRGLGRAEMEGADFTQYPSLISTLAEVQLLISDPLSRLPLTLRQRLGVVDYFSFCRSLCNFLEGYAGDLGDGWHLRVPHRVGEIFQNYSGYTTHAEWRRVRRVILFAHEWPDPSDSDLWEAFYNATAEDWVPISEVAFERRMDPSNYVGDKRGLLLALQDDAPESDLNGGAMYLPSDEGITPEDLEANPDYADIRAALGDFDDDFDIGEFELAEDVELVAVGPPLNIATFTSLTFAPTSEDCTICLEPFQIDQVDPIVQVPCQHCFHARCLETLVNGVSRFSNLCPNCRQQICERRPTRPVLPDVGTEST
jgi:hypothetical protein